MMTSRHKNAAVTGLMAATKACKSPPWKLHLQHLDAVLATAMSSRASLFQTNEYT
jgi:hypothetical protein